jgi:hypothetical protein
MSATTPVSTHAAQTTRSPWRSVGLWMTALLVAYLFFNVARAIANPAGFAAYFGIPLDNPGDDAFVLVYAIRTLFLGLFGLALLLRRSYASLALYLLVATVMPIGDALLVWQRGGEPSIIARHIAITGIILLTWFLTNRWVQRALASGA